VVEEGLRPELHLPRRRQEAARTPRLVTLGVFGVLRRQQLSHAAGLGAKLVQGDAARRELLPIGGLDIAVPELLAKAETRSKAEHDLGVGPRFAGWGDHGRPKLHLRLRLRADFEADLQRFAFEAGCGRQHDVGKR
jgi:hypothetical protein